MKHYSDDYLLASCFKCFDDKLVRFFVPNGMIDVGIKSNESDEFSAAILKNKHSRINQDEYSKSVWCICNYIINNMNETNSKTDFLESVSYSKIEIIKLDFYTLKITLRISNKNQTNTNSIILDNHDVWFISKLLTFVCSTLTRKIF